MYPRTLLLLPAVLALGAVACETDAAPQPLTERATPETVSEAPAVTAPVLDHTAITDLPPVDAAPAPLPAPGQPPPAGHGPSPALPVQPPAVARPVAPPPALPSHEPGHHGHHGHVHHGHSPTGGGVGAVVDRIAPLP